MTTQREHTDRGNDRGWFTNKDEDEYLMFRTKVRTLCRSGDAKTDKAIDAFNATEKEATPAFERANTALYDVIVKITDDRCQLMTTYDTRFSDDGWSIMQYLASKHAVSANKNRKMNAAQEYKKLASAKYDKTMTGEEFSNVMDKMLTLQAQLKNTDREIPDKTFIQDIYDMAVNIDKDYDYKLKTMWTIDYDYNDKDFQDKDKVMAVLEECIEFNKNEKKKVEQEPEAPVTQSMLAALARNAPQGRKEWLSPCDLCGVPHKNGGQVDSCFAFVRSKGEEPDGWDKIDQKQKERIDSRANDIKNKGPWKDRDKSRNTRNNGKNQQDTLKSLLCLLGTLPVGDMMPIPSVQSAKVSILVDSQTIGQAGAPSYHIIKDKQLFSQLDETAKPVSVQQPGGDVVMSSGTGTCKFMTTSGSIMQMSPCVWVPSFLFNLMSVKAVRDKGAVRICFEQCAFITQDGHQIPFDPDTYSLSVIPLHGEAAMLAAANVISTGKDGKMKIDNSKLTDRNPKQRKELKAWSARLGDPPASVLRRLHETIEGAPDVFRKANDNNTLSDAKLFATGRKLPTPAKDAPVATEPGQVTACDYWDAKMTSRITGDKGYFTFVDIHSGKFRVYCTKSKADAVKYTDEYFMDAARDNVDIKPGSVRYSDNERIFISIAMNDKSR
jgi:hypothetical protein